MRCEDARKLLTDNVEPAEAVLGDLFAHVDSCSACESMDASLEAIAPIAALQLNAVPAGADFYGQVEKHLNECESAITVIDKTVEEPTEDLISSSFEHVDDCGSCREEISEGQAAEPLKAYSSTRIAPDLSRFADKVWARVGVCATVYSVLSASAAAGENPSEETLSRVYEHIEECGSCQALEEAQVAAPLVQYAAVARQLPAGFSESFYGGVEQRLGLDQSAVMRIGPGSNSRLWSISGLVLAMAASFLVAMTLWQAFDSEPNKAPGHTPDLAKNETKHNLGDFEGLSDFVPGNRVFLDVESVTNNESESFSNEVQLPGNGAQYRLPTTTPTAPKNSRKSKSKNSDTALSF
jgi:hypothetical protein